ncbi:Uncharacterised protein [Yersinia frederiksenii]|jgi:Na+-transporting NADH:ubiquinone oxidoreductase subunit NqrA|nr:Uncharacterised protein [Yersinia frederiksenii]
MIGACFSSATAGKECWKLAFNDILLVGVLFLPQIVLNLSVVAYFRHTVESDEKLWDD